MITPCLIVFGTALIIGLLLTPLAIRLAPVLGAMDVPRDARRMHDKPMPRMGGFAIFFASVLTILLWLPLQNNELQPGMLPDHRMLGILLGGTIMALIGLVDDIRGLPAKVKLLGQIVCATIVFAFSVRFSFISIPFTGGTTEDFPFWFSYVLTVLWIVGISNTINLIDGLDGLAGGISAISATSIAYIAYIHGNYDVCMALLAVAGGCCGFLPFNFHPARIFMGDGGSLFLGFMLASVSLLSLTKSATFMVMLVPVFVLALPIFDTTFAILRRMANHRPIMEADRGHLHHRLMAAGLGQRRTVVTMYAISGVMSVAAILVSRRLYIESLLLLATAAALIYVFLTDPHWKASQAARAAAEQPQEQEQRKE